MIILVMGIMLTVLEGMSEGFMAIVNVFKRVVDRMIFKYKLRKRRGGCYIKRNYGHKNPYSIL